MVVGLFTGLSCFRSRAPGAWALVVVACGLQSTGSIEVAYGLICPLETALVGSTGLPGSSAGKEFSNNTGDLGSIPELGRSPGEGEMVGWHHQLNGHESE